MAPAAAAFVVFGAGDSQFAAGAGNRHDEDFLERLAVERRIGDRDLGLEARTERLFAAIGFDRLGHRIALGPDARPFGGARGAIPRSEDHASELQSLMRSSYAGLGWSQIKQANEPHV